MARLLSSVNQRFGAAGVRAQAQLRADTDKPYLTWMETYTCESAAQAHTIVVQLPALVAQAGLLPLIDGERHHELFSPLGA